MLGGVGASRHASLIVEKQRDANKDVVDMLSTPNYEVVNASGFNNITNYFNMDSNNMSLGASNVMPGVKANNNNQSILAKEKNEEHLE